MGNDFSKKIFVKIYRLRRPRKKVAISSFVQSGNVEISFQAGFKLSTIPNFLMKITGCINLNAQCRKIPQMKAPFIDFKSYLYNFFVRPTTRGSEVRN